MPAPEFLISPELSLNALIIAGSDKAFNVYLHDQAGDVSVSAGFAPQVVTTLAPTASWIQAAERQFARISSIVNIGFNRVYDQSLSDISFFIDTEIFQDEASGSITMGVQTPNRDNQTGRQWSEIFLNGPEINKRPEDFGRYVFNHELLHALGLEHTFDNSDGDFYLSTDPQQSATPEESVMSYRTPTSGVYPADFSQYDYEALGQIWGFAPLVEVDDSSSAASTSQVFRLYQQSTGRHLYSSNSNEIDLLTGSGQSDYINEGIAYVVGEGAGQDLYRFFQPATGLHFYSANTSERDGLLAQADSGYLYEGVAYKVFDAASAPTGSTAVARIYDPLNNTHFYSASAEEQQILQTTQPGWVMEGTAWYA